MKRIGNREQIMRIREMERRLVRATSTVKRLSALLDKYESVLEDVAVLDRYYGGEEWRQDLADDEAGLLPQGLKRGVLSEDAIWNLLSDCRELNSRMKEVVCNHKNTTDYTD